MKESATKITFVYFILGLFWIFLSDILLIKTPVAKEQVLVIQLIKGGLYVIVTSSLLYFLISRYSKNLRESELQYKKLFDENPSPVLIYDVNSLEILAVNNAAESKYGFSRKEFLSMAIKDLRSEEGIERMNETLAAGGESRENGVLQHKKKNGEVFYVNVYSHTIIFNHREARMILAIDVHEKYLAEQKILQLTQELRERKDYLGSLIDSQSNFLIRINSQGYYTFVNKAFCQTLGYDIKSLIGRSFFDIIMPEDYEIYHTMIEACIREPGKVITAETRKSNEEGDLFVINWEFVGVAEASGKTIEIQGVGHEVTQKHEYFTQLTEIKERLENILSTVHDVVWSANADDLSILYINPACEEVSGYTQQEFYQNKHLWMNRIFPEDQERVRQELVNLLSYGQREVEYRIRHKDGSIRHIYNKATLAKDRKSVSIITGIATDVTAKKMTEAQAKENAKVKEEILESITDGFFAVDKSWNFTYLNKECERMLYVRREEVLGKNGWEVFPDAVRGKFFTEYHRAMQENISVKVEEYLPSIKTWFRASAYPTNDGLAVYFQDITQERVLSMEAERSEKNLIALINNTHDVIWSVDASLRLLSANQPFFKAVKQLTGKDIHKGDEVFLFATEEKDRDKWKNHYLRALKGESYRIVDKEVSSEGERYVETSFNPIISGKQVIGVGCIARDITESRKNEARISLQNQILREIAHTQSHDLRRPVATIMGLVSLFDKQNLSSQFNAEVMEKVSLVCEELDVIIHKIVEKTYELDNM